MEQWEDSNSSGNSFNWSSSGDFMGIGGGLITRVHGRKARKHAEHMQEIANYRADTAIQRRVADAKAAGIHPLFALGANLGGGDAITLDYGESGAAQAVAGLERGFERRAQREAHDEGRALREAQMRVLQSEANRNDSVTQLNAQSYLGRAAQAANSSQDGGTVIVPSGGSIQHQPLKVTPVPRGAKFRSAWGIDMALDPRFSMDHSQLAQDRWGEPGEWAEGLPLYVRDAAAGVSDSFRSYIDDVVSGRALQRSPMFNPSQEY